MFKVGAKSKKTVLLFWVTAVVAVLCLCAVVAEYILQKHKANADLNVFNAVAGRVDSSKPLKILCMGDAFTSKDNVNTCWPDELKTELSARFSSRNIDVVNFSFPGANSKFLASNLNKVLTSRGPFDVVAVLSGANDGARNTEFDLESENAFSALRQSSRLLGFFDFSKTYWDKIKLNFVPLPENFWKTLKHTHISDEAQKNSDVHALDVSKHLRGRMLKVTDKKNTQADLDAAKNYEKIADYVTAARSLSGSGQISRITRLWDRAFEQFEDKPQVFCAALKFYMDISADIQIQKLINTGILKGIVNAQGFKFIGDYYVSKQKWTFAQKAYENALSLDPANARLHVALGFMWRSMGDINKATQACRQAITVDPEQDWAYIELGNIELGKGNVQQAFKMFSKAYELKPDYAGTLVDMGKCQLLLGKQKDALFYFNKALQRKSLDVQDMITVGDLLKQHGFALKSRAVYEQARLKSMVKTSDQLRYGASVMSRKDKETDLFFSDMLAANANNPEVLKLIMNYYYRTKHDRKKADQIYARLLLLRQKQQQTSRVDFDFPDASNISIVWVLNNSKSQKEFDNLLYALCAKCLNEGMYERALGYTKLHCEISKIRLNKNKTLNASGISFVDIGNLIALCLPVREFLNFLDAYKDFLPENVLTPILPQMPSIRLHELSKSWSWAGVLVMDSVFDSSWCFKQQKQESGNPDLKAFWKDPDNTQLGVGEYLFLARGYALENKKNEAWQALLMFFKHADNKLEAVTEALKMSMDIYDRQLGLKLLEYIKTQKLDALPVQVAKGEFFVFWQDWDQAQKAYEQALVLSPGNVEVFLGQAVAWRLKGDFEKSKQAFFTVIAQHPENIRAHIELGNLLFDEEKFKESLILFSDVLKLHPDNTAALMKAGQCLMLLKRKKQAVVYLDRAVASGKLDLRSLVDIAHIFESRGFTKKARHVKKLVINKALEDVFSAIEFGQILIKSKIDFDANLFIHSVLEKYSDNVKLLLLLANYCRQNKDYKLAYNVYLRLEELVPDNEQVQQQIKTVRQLLGIEVKAEPEPEIIILNSALRQLIEQGQNYLQTREFAKALRVFKLAHASYPDFLEGFFWLGVCYMRSENQPKADFYFQQVAKNCDPGSRILVRIAFEYFRQNITDKGFVYIKSVWKTKGYNFERIITLADQAMLNGNFMLAKGLLDGVQTLDSQNIQAYFKKGVLFWRMNQMHKSKYNFTRFIELDNHSVGAYLEVIKFLRQQKDAAMALKYCYECHDRYPDNFRLAVETAFSLDLIGKNKQADRTLLALIDDNWNSSADIELWGDLFVARKRYKKAVEIFLRGIRLFPKSAGLYVRIGRVLFDMGQVAKAKNAYLRAVYYDRNNLEANYMAWRCSFLCGVAPELIKPLLNQAVKFANKDIKAAKYLGRYFLFSGTDLSLAGKMFKKASLRLPFDSSTRFDLVLWYGAMGNIAGLCSQLGINTLQEVYCAGNYQPEFYRVYGLLGSLLAKTGFTEQAEVFLNRIDQLDSKYFAVPTRQAFKQIVNISRTHNTGVIFVQYPYCSGKGILRMWRGKLPDFVKVCAMRKPFYQLLKQGPNVKLWQNLYGASYGKPLKMAAKIIAVQVADCISKGFSKAA